MAAKNKLEQTYFVPVDKKIIDNIYQGGSYSLPRGYVDNSGKVNGKPGEYIEYVTSIDPKKGPQSKLFQFNQSLGRLQTRMTDVSVNGVKQYDFLKNYPECEGSPNGTYEIIDGNKVQVNVTFRELNAAKDAELALKIERLTNKAGETALALDDETMTEIANVGINYFGDADDFMRLKVVEFAKKRPVEFNALMAEANRSYQSVIRKGLKEGVFTGVGPMVKLDQIVIGNNENDAVAYLRSHPDVYEAVKQKLDFEPVDKKK